MMQKRDRDDRPRRDGRPPRLRDFGDRGPRPDLRKTVRPVATARPREDRA
jgi:small subunit ribosomal protein S6